jgi:hypothetical protein
MQDRLFPQLRFKQDVLVQAVELYCRIKRSPCTPLPRRLSIRTLVGALPKGVVIFVQDLETRQRELPVFQILWQADQREWSPQLRLARVKR